ncbi:hypothetical protein L6452_21746 [Arctium lappa]|uniref:Uncharacterized protein n=1 Tax=Arctium lappa TaxID=4217 RepID=A0ACB9AXX1_ARCLA|nr:hypothetical protein L6452_21746 [Arctium lappa]
MYMEVHTMSWRLIYSSAVLALNGCRTLLFSSSSSSQLCQQGMTVPCVTGTVDLTTLSQFRIKFLSCHPLGFTIAWLPPPTESISPKGYMPNDLYNLNSRYGHVNELKALVNKFHEVGIKVLGDAVINHRCAHYQNQNGVGNKF